MNAVPTSGRNPGLFSIFLVIGAACFFLHSVARAQTILIPTNAVWKYLDSGDLITPSWREVRFDDSLQKSGPAELGFGMTPEGSPVRTPVNYGPDPAHKYITTYFRHAFVVTNLMAISNLTVTLQSLNGGVVYLNYFETYRTLMPSGPISFSTLALPTELIETGESPYLTRTINRNLLNEGINVIAVEVHLSSPTNADLSFALKLAAHYGEPLPAAPSIRRGPYLQMGTPSGVTVRWRTDLPTNSRVQY